MIKLEKEIRDQLASYYDIGQNKLQFLAGGREDSDGILYTFMQRDKKKVLKICATNNIRVMERAKMKMELAHYLGENGVNVACPKPGKDGTVFHTVEDKQYIYFSSIMDYIEGESPEIKEYSEDTIRKWGKLTGKLHATTKSFPIWKSIPGGTLEWGFEEEISQFYDWCHNEIVKEKWKKMKTEMSSWEKNRNTYGFIHNDNHHKNLIVQTNQLTLIDFDCAECTFFLQDLLAPLQGVLFDQSGGFNRPITDMETIKKFYDHFLAGYETENHIEDQWLARLETALNYRRLLLYTVMQDWMESDKTVGDSFLRMIEDPCRFSIL